MALAAISPDYGLRPCPFCGGKRPRVNHAHRCYLVVCLRVGCEAQGPRHYEEQMAMDLWQDWPGAIAIEREIEQHDGVLR